MLDRGKAFLYRAGTVIMLVSLLLWAATNFPMHNGQPPAIQDSVVASVGHAIEPVIRPLGFDWKIGVGLVTSLAAREVIIATLGTLNGIDAEVHSFDLQQALQHELTLPAAIALLVFFAFAMQCMSTLAVVRRETNGWKWPAIQFVYMTLVAYVSAFAAYPHRGIHRSLRSRRNQLRQHLAGLSPASPHRNKLGSPALPDRRKSFAPGSVAPFSRSSPPVRPPPMSRPSALPSPLAIDEAPVPSQTELRRTSRYAGESCAPHAAQFGTSASLRYGSRSSNGSDRTLRVRTPRLHDSPMHVHNAPRTRLLMQRVHILRA